MTLIDSRSTANWYTTCPLCAGNALANRYRIDGFTIASCAGCSLVFVRERMSNETLKPYYDLPEQDFVYDDPSNQANLDYYYAQMKDVITRYVPSGKILDVGCNRGQFLDMMGDRWDRYGVELAPHFAEQSRQKYGDHVYHGLLENFPAQEDPFDVVTVMDVLDHCPDPVAELRHVNRLMRPGGLVVVKVHNISCLWAKVVRDKFYAFIPPYHLYYFDRKTLAQTLGAAGFQVKETRYMPHRMNLKTVPYRLARGKTSGLWFDLYKLLSRSRLGNVKIYKNLHDLITMIAVKEHDA
jgi:2-polyprenyl-3-methyl-5-hydroxy-6-metoxy-1,4-benzoquinol methylase